MTIEFWCVLCGQRHVAERAMAGRETPCTQCHTLIRVPPLTLPVSQQSIAPEESLPLEPAHARAALMGIALLQGSIVLLLCAVMAMAVSVAFACHREGLDALLDWVWKQSRNIIANGGTVACALLLVAAGLRGFGYHKLRRLDQFLGGSSILGVAHCGLTLQALAWLLLLFGAVGFAPTLSLAISIALAVSCGIVLEFPALATFRRVFVHTGGRRLAEGVRNYIVVIVSVTAASVAFLIVPWYILNLFGILPGTSRERTLVMTAYGVVVGAIILGLSLSLWQRILVQAKQQIHQSLAIQKPATEQSPSLSLR